MASRGTRIIMALEKTTITATVTEILMAMWKQAAIASIGTELEATEMIKITTVAAAEEISQTDRTIKISIS